jgi:hypothetical protein
VTSTPTCILRLRYSYTHCAITVLRCVSITSPYLRYKLRHARLESLSYVACPFAVLRLVYGTPALHGRRVGGGELPQSRGGGEELQCGVRISETGIRTEINAQWVVKERLKTCHWKTKNKCGFVAVWLWFQDSSYPLSLEGNDVDNKSVY